MQFHFPTFQRRRIHKDEIEPVAKSYGYYRLESFSPAASSPLRRSPRLLWGCSFSHRQRHEQKAVQADGDEDCRPYGSAPDRALPRVGLKGSIFGSCPEVEGGGQRAQQIFPGFAAASKSLTVCNIKVLTSHWQAESPTVSNLT